MKINKNKNFFNLLKKVVLTLILLSFSIGFSSAEEVENIDGVGEHGLENATYGIVNWHITFDKDVENFDINDILIVKTDDSVILKNIKLISNDNLSVYDIMASYENANKISKLYLKLNEDKWDVVSIENNLIISSFENNTFSKNDIEIGVKKSMPVNRPNRSNGKSVSINNEKKEKKLGNIRENNADKEGDIDKKNNANKEDGTGKEKNTDKDKEDKVDKADEASEIDNVDKKIKILKLKIAIIEIQIKIKKIILARKVKNI